MFRITVSPTGQQFDCRQDQFVIDAMLSARCGPVTYGCCGGGCGVCRMKVQSGEYEIVKRMSRSFVSQDDLKNNIVLICCIQPRGDLILTRVENIKQER